MTSASKYCFRLKILFASFIFGLLLFVSMLVLLRKILSYYKKRTIVHGKITKMCLQTQKHLWKISHLVLRQALYFLEN